MATNDPTSPPMNEHTLGLFYDRRGFRTVVIRTATWLELGQGCRGVLLEVGSKYTVLDPDIARAVGHALICAADKSEKSIIPGEGAE